MTPQQFIASLEKGPAPAYLFLGPEMYRRDVCRKKLIERFLSADERQDGWVRHDLDEISLDGVIEDASSLSLFVSRRLVWVSSAEAALPKRLDADVKEGAGLLLERYLRNPSPDVVLVFDVKRYELEGEDKARIERVRKFYSGISNVVEFPPYDAESARKLAQDLAKRSSLQIAQQEIDALVEALGSDASLLAQEIEKLRLYAGAERRITADDIAALAPNARTATIFSLVNALARGDRAASLDLLDTLIRDGEYLPLALTFLATQFRFALVAREEGLRSPQQIQAHFQRIGVPMWPSRAQQVFQTVNAFSQDKIERAVVGIFRADRGLRDTRPDDRVIMERLVLEMTA